MKVKSICVQCQHQNVHEVDNNGQATVTCESCNTVYTVQSYEVRAKGGRRDRSTGIKRYSIRVKEPDRDERMLEFDSDKDIEMRSGDQITGSYAEGKLKYLVNQKINQYWDVQIKKSAGCFGTLIGIAIIATIVGVIIII